MVTIYESEVEVLKGAMEVETIRKIHLSTFENEGFSNPV